MSFDQEPTTPADRKKELALEKEIAELEKAVSEAKKAAAEADRARVAALIPNLTDANKSELTEDAADPVMLGTLVAHHALNDVLDRVYDRLRKHVVDKSVLVSGNEAQAASDAVYVQVRTSIEGLTTLADTALAIPKATGGVEPTVALAAPLLGAIASAIPSVLAAFSSKRTLKSEALTVDTKTAVATLAGRLTQVNETKVWLDDVRPIPVGPTIEGVKLLQQRRVELQKMAAAPSKEDDADRVALAKQVVAAIDSFLTAVLSIPVGASRSPYAEAALREQLHSTAGDSKIDLLLVVTSTSADSQQSTDDRAFMLEDKYNVVASIAVRYVLIDAKTGQLLAGGSETGTAQIKGKIGGELTIELAKHLNRVDGTADIDSLEGT